MAQVRITRERSQVRVLYRPLGAVRVATLCRCAVRIAESSSFSELRIQDLRTFFPDPGNKRHKEHEIHRRGEDHCHSVSPPISPGLPHSGHTPVTFPVRLCPHLRHNPFRRRRFPTPRMVPPRPVLRVPRCGTSRPRHRSAHPRAPYENIPPNGP